MYFIDKDIVLWISCFCTLSILIDKNSTPDCSDQSKVLREHREAIGHQYQEWSLTPPPYQCLISCSLSFIHQIAAIRAKYDKLETEMREKREITNTQIQEFMDKKLGVILSDLRRELKLTEARLRDNHQVCACWRVDQSLKTEQANYSPIMLVFASSVY